MRLAAQIPNVLTAARLLLTPFVAGAILGREFGRAFALCLLAGVTDTADGYLARRFRWYSRLGALLDPVADKALLMTVFATLGWVGVVPAGLVAVVFGRDLLILAGVAVLWLTRGITEFPPSPLGKLSTTVQILTAAVVLAGAIPAEPGPAPAIAANLLIGMTILMAVASGADYLRRGVLAFRRPPLPGGG